MIKVCSKCNIEKNIDEFYYRKNRNSYISVCKKCKCEKDRINWLKRKEINPEYDRNRYQKRKKNNPESLNKSTKKRYSNNKKYWKEYREKNIESKKTYAKNYYKKNNLNEYHKKYTEKKRKHDYMFRLISCVRSSVNRYLYKKKINSFEIIGCLPVELKKHLEKKFTEGMCWENHGKYGWHIDHIIPLSSAKTEDELYRLCHYTNLQPLWAKDNLKKSSKILI